MARPTHSLPTDTRISAKLRWQLFFSHLLVAGLTWLFFLPFQAGTSTFPYTFLGLEVVFVAGVIGLLMTTNIWLGVQKLERLLLQLAKGSVTEPLNQLFLGRLGWPFRTLLTNLDVILGRITDTTFRFDQLHQARDQWLSQVGEAAAQSERNRLARELHDTIKQQLFSIGASTTSAQLRWESDPVEAKADLATVRQLVMQAQSEMKALLQQLQPSLLDSVGLYDALRDQCEALGYRTGAAVKLEAFQMPPADRLPAQAEQTIFRVAGEALNNIARHARASEVVLTLLTHQQDGKEWLTLTVADDGQGFDATKTNDSGMGLRGITERAKQLGAFISVDSVIDDGTILELWIPLIEPARAAFTPEQIKLETKATKLHARLIKTTVWSSLVAGVSFFIFLLNFPFDTRQTEINPLGVLRAHLFWTELAIGFVTLNYLYVWYSVQRVLGWRVFTTPKALELASFRNILSIVLGVMGFIVLPSVPFWLTPLAINNSSLLFSLLLSILLASFILLSFAQRLKLSQVQYKLATLVQQNAWNIKGRHTLRRGVLYLPIEVIILWFVLKPTSLHFPAVMLEDWRVTSLFSFLALGIIGQVMYYWVIWEHMRGRAFRRGIARGAFSGLASIVLAVIIILNLTVPTFQTVAAFGIVSSNADSTTAIAWSPDQTEIAFLEKNTDNSNYLLFTDFTTNTTKYLTRSYSTFMIGRLSTEIYWSYNGQTLNMLDIGLELKLTQWSLNDLKSGSPSLGYVVFEDGLYKYMPTFTTQPTILLSPDHQSFLVQINSQWSLRSLPDGKIIRTVNLPLQNGNGMTWSPDGQKLAFFNKDMDAVEVFSPLEDRVISYLMLPYAASVRSSIAWSPDSQALAASYTAPTAEVILWNVATEQVQSILIEPSNDFVADVAWSPDGHTVAVSTEHNIILWDNHGYFQGSIATDTIIFDTAGQNAVFWSLDSRFLASDNVGKLTIWRVNL